MKKLVMVAAILSLAVVFLLPVVSSAQGPWKGSPDNWNNSPYNWQNDPNNWNNSPDNWNRKNGIYDESGRSSGYVTPKSGGGFNIFDNEGNRIGYKP